MAGVDRVSTAGRPGPRPAGRRQLERARQVLCDPALGRIVDLVAHPDPAGVVVANARGVALLSAADPDGPAQLWAGQQPLPNQDPLAFTPLAAELADPSPPNERNCYPFAAARLASLFADPRAPDLAVVHTPRHYWPERGGHRGEHGSLDLAQSRGPLLLCGAGVLARGLLPAAARVVDVAPTLAWLAGAPLAGLAGLDGQPLVDLAVPTARHVVGVLWDGANGNEVLALAADGTLPTVRRLLDRGCALAGGAIAEFPSVTLTNHCSALTGVGPGRHGMVNNAFYDRAHRRRVLANEAATWHLAAELMRPGVRTVFQMVPDGGTGCINEPVDRGADYSTFAVVRDSGHADGAKAMTDLLPDPARDRHATVEHVHADGGYAFSTQVDALGLAQALQLWETADDAPRFTWWNATLPDTGHHNGGPHSPLARAALVDSDRRLGEFLDRVDRFGLTERTVVLLTADHGSEAADESCRGDWDEALQSAGIPFRDEAYGFIYLGTDGNR